MNPLAEPRSVNWPVAIGVGVLLIAAAVAGIAFFFGGDPAVVSGAGDNQVEPVQSRNFVFHPVPRALPEITFNDADGQLLTLADFKGKSVLLNIWATWCVPCREEMPTLDALQAELGSDQFEVVPLSIDRAGPEVVREFYNEIGIQRLRLFIDASMKASFDLSVVGLPTTLLVDARGQELGRLVGPAEWDDPALMEAIKTRISPNWER